MGKTNQYSIQSLGDKKCVIVRNPASNFKNANFKKLVQPVVEEHKTIGATAYIDFEIGLDSDTKFFECSLVRAWSAKHSKIQETENSWDIVRILKKAFASDPLMSQSNSAGQFNKINNHKSIDKATKKQWKQFNDAANTKYGIDQYDDISNYLVDALLTISSKNPDNFSSFLENLLDVSSIQANAMKSKSDGSVYSVDRFIEEMQKSVQHVEATGNNTESVQHIEVIGNNTESVQHIEVIGNNIDSSNGH